MRHACDAAIAAWAASGLHARDFLRARRAHVSLIRSSSLVHAQLCRHTKNVEQNDAIRALVVFAYILRLRVFACSWSPARGPHARPDAEAASGASRPPKRHRILWQTPGGLISPNEHTGLPPCTPRGLPGHPGAAHRARAAERGCRCRASQPLPPSHAGWRASGLCRAGTLRIGCAASIGRSRRASSPQRPRPRPRGYRRTRCRHDGRAEALPADNDSSQILHGAWVRAV